MSKRRYYARKRRFRRKARARFYVILGVLIAALAVGIFFIVKAVTDKPGSPEKPGESMVLSPPNKSGLLEPVESETPTETPEPSMPADLLPQPVAGMR